MIISSWVNAQYSTRNFVKITGIAKSILTEELKWKICDIAIIGLQMNKSDLEDFFKTNQVYKH